MPPPPLPPSPGLKLDLMFQGLRYSDALGAAAEHSYPNFFPYRFAPGEADPTGTGKAAIPYLLRLDDGTQVRVKGEAGSPWRVEGDRDAGYRLCHDDDRSLDIAVDFEPLPPWMRRRTDDGTAMPATGISQHGDMLVVNVAPGCQYFMPEAAREGPARCTFCTYGRPDARMEALGQSLDRVELPERTYDRMRQTLRAALDSCEIHHIYLVGGSMLDWREEGERFIELAREVQRELDHAVPLTCGSGALPPEALAALHAERLVDNVCFNLEVWSPALFEAVCPGKARFVGYERWLEALDGAVRLFGRGHVYSAMVAGIELEPEHGLDLDGAVELALAGAADLCERGVLPVYSLYWPPGGRQRGAFIDGLREYYQRLSLGYAELRDRLSLRISGDFMCHRCAYMQLECDLDRNPRRAAD